MTVKEFQELHEAIAALFAALSKAEPALAAVFAEKAAKMINGLVEELGETGEAWKELSPEQRLEEEIDAADWRRSDYSRDAEWVKADQVPNLVKYLEAKGGKAFLAGYSYYLSQSGRTVTRYRRREKKGGEAG